MIDGPYKLPEGWRWVRLGEACQINPRRPRLDVNPTTEVTFVPMSAVDAELGIIYTPEIKPFSAVKTGYTYFEENDVLFAKITPCMENGKSAVARGLLNNIGFGSTEFHVLRPIDSVLSEWIWLYVRKKDFLESARAAFRGGVGQQRVPAEFLQEACIPLPPLHEQQRIVAKVEMIMEQIREARRLRQKAVEDADRLWQAVLADTFPRPGTDLPHNWRWVRLGEVCNYQNGVWGAQDPKGYPVLRSKNFTNEGFLTFEEVVHIKLTERQVNKGRLHRGDILLERSGGGPNKPVGRVCIFTETPTDEIYCFGNFITVLRPLFVNLDVWFIFNYLHWVYISGMTEQLQTQTTNIRNLRFKEYMDIFIPLPPLEEQRRIVAYLETTHEKIISLINSQAQFETELQRLEQSILDSAFKGEL